jgi:lipoprotein-anchoring transpeptidase ErfK/SrfK
MKFKLVLGLVALAVMASPALAAKPKTWKYPKAVVAVADGGPKKSISANAPGVKNVKTGYGAGQVVVDQGGRKLYYMISKTKAYVYPIAVGKPGFKWSGTQRVSGIQNWPQWTPPKEMRERKPYLPLTMTGGVRNPLGAKAIYLGSTEYRIHGTNDDKSIGTAASSGCIRMHNGHVLHLASLVKKGTTVHVVRSL